MGFRSSRGKEIPWWFQYLFKHKSQNPTLPGLDVISLEFELNIHHLYTSPYISMLVCSCAMWTRTHEPWNSDPFMTLFLLFLSDLFHVCSLIN